MAERLQYFRELKKKTQLQMADMLGVKRCTYASYEEGRAEPSIYTLKKFCRECKIKVDEFLQTSPEEPAQQC